MDTMSADTAEAPTQPPLRSRHTETFPALLARLGVSVAVTTYQAGKLVLLRADGDRVNTHFRDLRRPMGLAADATRLAVGTALEVRQYRNLPPACRHLDPPGRHDACFVPRSTHVTGDIDVHEMTWVGAALWFVNTRFSCLCTLDGVHSFVPRWRPPFVSALAPEDRCHLNGLWLADAGADPGAVPAGFVTALGATDTAQGWRARKRDGGVVLEVPTGEVVAGGLSMPHSPRWYRDRLWVLESGTGGFGFIDRAGGRYRAVAGLPGFTRGLDFCGDFAFVGLSQVRESAVFGGVPVAERPDAERCCGVWVVDLTTGRTAAFLRFEGAVREVFGVSVLHGLRFPEVVADGHGLLAGTFDIPSSALGDVPPGLRHGGPTAIE